MSDKTKQVNLINKLKMYEKDNERLRDNYLSLKQSSLKQAKEIK